MDCEVQRNDLVLSQDGFLRRVHRTDLDQSHPKMVPGAYWREKA